MYVVVQLIHRPSVCTFYNSDFLIISSMISFYIPCLAMLALYWRIFVAIRLRERKTKNSYIFSTTSLPNDCKPNDVINRLNSVDDVTPSGLETKHVLLQPGSCNDVTQHASTYLYPGRAVDKDCGIGGGALAPVFTDALRMSTLTRSSTREGVETTHLSTHNCLNTGIWVINSYFNIYLSIQLKN